MFRCSHTIIRERIIRACCMQPHHHGFNHTDVSYFNILTTVTLASTSNALPEDGVTAPKHVGAVLM